MMTNDSATSSKTHSMRTSAQWAEKLKKLLQAPPLDDTMEIDPKELKKCTCMLTSVEVQMLSFNPIHGKCAFPPGYS